MKSPLPLRGGRSMAGILGCLYAVGTASSEEVPRGTLHVDQDLVRVGAHSQLDWQIEYPEPVATADTPRGIEPAKNLKMRVRILGSALEKVKNNSGGGNNVDGVDISNPKILKDGLIDPSAGIDDEMRGPVTSNNLPIEFLWSSNGAGWTSIFNGNQSSVQPGTVILDVPVQEGDAINFGGRGWGSGSWLGLYHTGTPTPNLVILKNGDKIPSSVPSINSGALKPFLKPYLDTNAQTVRIGDRDMILLLELFESNPLNPNFDLQDLAVLVTFE